MTEESTIQELEKLVNKEGKLTYSEDSDLHEGFLECWYILKPHIEKALSEKDKEIKALHEENIKLRQGWIQPSKSETK